MTRWLRGHSRAEELGVAFQSERRPAWTLSPISHCSEYCSNTPYQGFPTPASTIQEEPDRKLADQELSHLSPPAWIVGDEFPVH